MGRKIVLISCASKKQSVRSQAKDLYVSTLFQLNLKYALSLNPDAVYILSAKYGLLELEAEVEPYNSTLNAMSNNEIKQWARRVIDQLGEKTDLLDDHFIFLAGDKYRKYLIPSLKSCEVPLEGLSIGRQLQYLKRNT
jgi:hypothetical protein